jgi:hypothetical protein
MALNDFLPFLSPPWSRTSLISRTNGTKRSFEIDGNAKRLGRNDVYRGVSAALIWARIASAEDPLEAEFAAVMRALEEALTEESGRTKRLSRTRQKLNRVGVRQTLADLALKPRPSLGFMKLLEFNMADMSAEALILKHRHHSTGRSAAAERRLTAMTFYSASRGTR